LIWIKSILTRVIIYDEQYHPHEKINLPDLISKTSL